MECDLVLEGKVVTPGGILDAEVGVDEGVVAEIGHGVKGYRRIATERCLIFPGFVDMHVHLREPGWEHKEDFRTGTEAAAHGGVTTVVDMPNTPIPTTTTAALEEKKRLARAKAVVRVEFQGGVVVGKFERIPELAKGVVSFKLYLSETTGTTPFPEYELGTALKEIARTKRPVSIHCEDQSVIDKMRESLRGVDRPDVNCDIRPPSAEVIAVERVVDAARTADGVRANVCHASVGETISLVKKARADKLRISCEAALHHLYFNREALLANRMLNTNPPLRREEDRQALLVGIRNGSVSFLVTDHAPHTEDEKRGGGPSGVPGLDDFGHVASWLIRSERVDPLTLAMVASSNPAAHLGLSDRGSIAVGKRADFAVLDLHSPEVVRNEDVRSKCGWSPYEGREFPGRVRWTVIGGTTLVDDFEPVS